MQRIFLAALIAALLGHPAHAQGSKDDFRNIKIGAISPISSAAQISRTSYKARFKVTKTTSFRRTGKLGGPEKTGSLSETTFGRENLTLTDTEIHIRHFSDACSRGGNKTDCAIREIEARTTKKGELIYLSVHDAKHDPVDLSGPKGKIANKILADMIKKVGIWQGGRFQSGDLVQKAEFQFGGLKIDLHTIAIGLSVIDGRNVLVCDLKGKVRAGSMQGRGDISGQVAIDTQTGASIYANTHIDLQGKSKSGKEIELVLNELKTLKIVSPARHSPLTSNERDIEGRLIQLKRLFNKGLISESDFEAKQREILKGL